MFDRLRSPELEDFIFAHDPAITLKKNIPNKKGSLEDAKQAIQNDTTLENNRILCLQMLEPSKQACVESRATRSRSKQ